MEHGCEIAAPRMCCADMQREYPPGPAAASMQYLRQYGEFIPGCNSQRGGFMHTPDGKLCAEAPPAAMCALRFRAAPSCAAGQAEESGAPSRCNGGAHPVISKIEPINV